MKIKRIIKKGIGLTFIKEKEPKKYKCDICGVKSTSKQYIETHSCNFN